MVNNKSELFIYIEPDLCMNFGGLSECSTILALKTFNCENCSDL